MIKEEIAPQTLFIRSSNNSSRENTKMNRPVRFIKDERKIFKNLYHIEDK